MLHRTIISLGMAIAFAVTAAAADVPKFRPAAGPTQFLGRYLVAINETSMDDTATVAAELARTYGGRIEPFARDGFRGFLVSMTPARARLLSTDPRVQWVEATTADGAVAEPGANWISDSTSWDSGAYSYDGAGNIIAIGLDGYAYDGFGRLVSATAITPDSPENRQTFTYDRNGNLLSVTTSTGNALATAEQTLDFAVDPMSNQLDGTCPTGTQGCVRGRYDAAGNQVGTIDADDYKWDALGMMTEVNLPNRQEQYVYDANDERIVILGQSNGLRRYTLRGLDSKVVREVVHDPATNGWSWEKDYVYRGGTLLAAYISGGTAPGPHRHYHVDHLGSTRLITDADGHKLATLTYWPFGQEAPGSESAPAERMKFTGHERDTNPSDPLATAYDLDYMHARYYGPNWGRFLSVDPTWESADLGRPQSWNRYAYVENNPVNRVDPDGRVLETLWDLANVAIGAKSFYDNVRSGKYGAAALDAGGVIIDVAAVVTPVVPGGVGTAIKVARAAEKADDVVDAAKSSRAARREAIRAEGIPTSQQPKSQSSPRGPGNKPAGREQVYDTPQGDKHVQHQLQDKNHGPHWEAGKPKPGGQTDPAGRRRLQNDKTKVDEKLR